MLGLSREQLRTIPEYTREIQNRENEKNASVSRWETRSKVASFVLLIFSILLVGGGVGSSLALLGVISSPILLYGSTALLGISSIVLIVTIVVKVKSAMGIRQLEENFRNYLENEIIGNGEIYQFLLFESIERAQAVKEAIASMSLPCFLDFVNISYCRTEPLTRQEGLESTPLNRNAFSVGELYTGVGEISCNHYKLLKHIVEDRRFDSVPQVKREWILANQAKD